MRGNRRLFFRPRVSYNRRMVVETGLIPDPVVEAYKKHIDRTLIRRNLKLSPEERLIQLKKLQEFAIELRRAGIAARKQR
jgi:hypothetical protein